MNRHPISKKLKDIPIEIKINEEKLEIIIQLHFDFRFSVILYKKKQQTL